MRDETKKFLFHKSIIKAGIYDILSCKNRRGIFKVKFIEHLKSKLKKKNFLKIDKPNQKSISKCYKIYFGEFFFHFEQEKLIE